MKKHNWKDLVFGMVLMSLVMGLVVPALAVSVRNVEITYRDVKLVIDGEPVIPRDVDGVVVEPFIMNGTTYLPARAIASALGKEVNWDASTSTVYLGELPAGTVIAPSSGGAATAVTPADLLARPNTAKAIQNTQSVAKVDGSNLVITPTKNPGETTLALVCDPDAVSFWISDFAPGEDFFALMKGILLDIAPSEGDAISVYNQLEQCVRCLLLGEYDASFTFDSDGLDPYKNMQSNGLFCRFQMNEGGCWISLDVE